MSVKLVLFLSTVMCYECEGADCDKANMHSVLCLINSGHGCWVSHIHGWQTSRNCRLTKDIDSYIEINHVLLKMFC